MMMKIMTTQNAGWSGADNDDEEDGVWMMRMLIKMMQYSS